MSKYLVLLIAMALFKWLTPWMESYDQPRQDIKKQRYYFVNKGPSSQGCGMCVCLYTLDLDALD